MSHNLEIIDGKASMAYAGETPWHNLGTQVPPDLDPQAMLEAANLDWDVQKRPTYFQDTDGNMHVNPDQFTLVRSSDNYIIDIVGKKWQPLQNRDAFDFFNRFVDAGEMEMHTAGCLTQDRGLIVWALAKVGETFEAVKGDPVESYLLFSNPHKFGAAIDVRFTPIRVVCNNTLSMAIAGSTSRMARVSHRTEFDPEAVMETLDIADTKFSAYKEAAQFLAKKRVNKDLVQQYFGEIFPSMSKKNDDGDKVSRQAKVCAEVLEEQPGAALGRGTMWQAFNAVTYAIDHKLSRSDNARLNSAWFGPNANRKTLALRKAVEYAEAA